MIDILKASDVVLIKIGAGLNLYEEGRDLAGVRKSVALTDADISRLVLGKQACHFARRTGY